MATSLKQWTLMPGAEVMEVGEGAATQRVLFGVPPCLKLFFQKKVPAPTTFVLPDEFFRKGVVQVCLEFFLYYFLFVLGKAFGKMPDDAKLVVIGTEDQLRRARRMLEVTLNGFTPEDMRRWTIGSSGRKRRAMPKQRTIAMLRRYQAWFAPKQPGFAQLKEFVARVLAHRKQTGETFALRDYPGLLGLTDLHPLVSAFIAATTEESLDDLRLVAYEFGRCPIDDVIEWRPFHADGTAPLASDVTLTRKGGGVFEVSNGTTTLPVDLNFTEDQAPYLITMPPRPDAVAPDVWKLLCLGSDSGFELEHPTTGFAICLNGLWALVDAPLCASYLLRQYGINPTDVRVIFETHGHEDHMGSAIHFLLECLAAGRSFTYVAAEPVYRTCIAKIAAILAISEDEADRMLTRAQGDGAPGTSVDAPVGGVIRVQPGSSLRLLGATWDFEWMVHPIPTLGFRIELEHDGRTYALAYSSDTAPAQGAMGLEAMAAEGFFDPADDPLPRLVRGNETLVLWEAGGTNGDPIHYHARDWAPMCAARGIDVPVTFMHVHPLPPEFRHHELARPGWTKTLVAGRTFAVGDIAAIVGALQSFPLRDPVYWLQVLCSQGRVETFSPGVTVVREGTDGDAWYLILQGDAEVVIGGKRVGTLGSRACFGELALLNDGKRQATVRANGGPLVVLRVPASAFRDFAIANELGGMFQQFWNDVAIIGATRLFVGFPHEIVAGLARNAERRRYPAGEALMRQGTVGDELFVIVRGETEVLRNGPDGRTDVLAVRGAGEIVGEYAVLQRGQRRSATVRATTDVEVLVIAEDDLHRIVAGQIPLQLRLVAMARERGLPDRAVAAS
ncbi:MAG: cyclic nucleotide-binding domain-containing protein [bacterium]|nr:cyclic nucleotide-binding domain-containing protein [bacterium]